MINQSNTTARPLPTGTVTQQQPSSGSTLPTNSGASLQTSAVPSQQTRPAPPLTTGTPSTLPAQAATAARVMPTNRQERRKRRNPDERVLGHLVSCSGSNAQLKCEAVKVGSEDSDTPYVGQILSVRGNNSRVVGFVAKVSANSNNTQKDTLDVIVDIELVGEVKVQPDGQMKFTRGISEFPPLGAIAHQIRLEDMKRIFVTNDENSFEIGTVSQDERVPAVINVQDLLAKHFAIFGTTGVGKSSTVSLLLRQAMACRPGLNVLLLDPHNEYASAFRDMAVVLNSDTLNVPFWLFELEEFAEAVFLGEEKIPEELEILRELIATAKVSFSGSSQEDAQQIRKSTNKKPMTADTPVPYKIADLLDLIDKELGSLQPNFHRTHLKNLKARVLRLYHDPRYRFMFSATIIEDNLHEALHSIFRVPNQGFPITILELAGIPHDVVNALVSVLCRLSFDLARFSPKEVEFLVVCEEAHRYVPHADAGGCGAVRRSIARIAKEGRKYGSYLGIVVQRPGELDPTILSQCSTIFSMRLANASDKKIVESAIAGGLSNSLEILSSLGNREAIAFGEAIRVPMRIKLMDLHPDYLPGHHIEEENSDVSQETSLWNILNRMRR